MCFSLTNFSYSFRHGFTGQIDLVWSAEWSKIFLFIKAGANPRESQTPELLRIVPDQIDLLCSIRALKPILISQFGVIFEQRVNVVPFEHIVDRVVDFSSLVKLFDLFIASDFLHELDELDRAEIDKLCDDHTDVLVCVADVRLLDFTALLEHLVEHLWFVWDVPSAMQEAKQNQVVSVNLALLVAENRRFYQFCNLRVVQL